MSLPMMSIFNGRERGVEGDQVRIFMKLYVEIREYLYLFNNGKNSNSLAIFLEIALHANEDGWAWPSADTVKTNTGITDDHTIADALKHLRGIRIEGRRIIDHYRVRIKGQWGRSYFHVFPESGGSDKLPTTDPFVLWLGQTQKAESEPLVNDPQVGEPLVDDPHVDDPHVGDPHAGDPQDSKGEPDSKEEPVKEENNRPAFSPARSSQEKRGRRDPLAAGVDAVSEEDKKNASEENGNTKRIRSVLESMIIKALPQYRKNGLPKLAIGTLNRGIRVGNTDYLSPEKQWEKSPKTYEAYVQDRIRWFKEDHLDKLAHNGAANILANSIAHYHGDRGFPGWYEAKQKESAARKAEKSAKTVSEDDLNELIRANEAGRKAVADRLAREALENGTQE